MDAIEIIEGLYRQYSLNIQRVCFLYLGDIAASEDAMQDTFLKAHENIILFKGRAILRHGSHGLQSILVRTC